MTPLMSFCIVRYGTPHDVRFRQEWTFPTAGDLSALSPKRTFLIGAPRQ